MNLLPSVNLMDVDDDRHGNGLDNHGTVSRTSNTNQTSNGHSLIDGDEVNNSSTDKPANGMEHDGNGEVSHSADMETTLSDDQKDDNELLIRILQFGRDLHTLKQQLTSEYGENAQHDKLLQEAFSLLAYPDPKSSPLAHLLEPSQRESVSSVLNSAILGKEKTSPRPIDSRSARFLRLQKHTICLDIRHWKFWSVI